LAPPESGWVYFNVNHVSDAVLARVRSGAPGSAPPRLVICDLSASPRMDLQAADALGGLADELAADGVKLQGVEAPSSVRDVLRAEGLDERLGGINRFTSVADAVEDFQARPMNDRMASKRDVGATT